MDIRTTPNMELNNFNWLANAISFHVANYRKSDKEIFIIKDKSTGKWLIIRKPDNATFSFKKDCFVVPEIVSSQFEISENYYFEDKEYALDCLLNSFISKDLDFKTENNFRKVVINCIFSALGYKKYFEMRGISCYFYERDFTTKKYFQVSIERATELDIFCYVAHTNVSEMSCEEALGLFFNFSSIKRDDQFLIKTFEELGNSANIKGRNFKILEIPADVDYEIDDNGWGGEWIFEKHRTWV